VPPFLAPVRPSPGHHGVGDESCVNVEQQYTLDASSCTGLRASSASAYDPKVSVFQSFFSSANHVCWFLRPCSCSSKFSLFILSGPQCELFQETTVCRFFIDAHEAAAGQAGIFVL
jgi:hypothetical protein